MENFLLLLSVEFKDFVNTAKCFDIIGHLPCFKGHRCICTWHVYIRKKQDKNWQFVRLQKSKMAPIYPWVISPDCFGCEELGWDFGDAILNIENYVDLRRRKFCQFVPYFCLLGYFKTVVRYGRGLCTVGKCFMWHFVGQIVQFLSRSMPDIENRQMFKFAGLLENNWYFVSNILPQILFRGVLHFFFFRGWMELTQSGIAKKKNKTRRKRK